MKFLLACLKPFLAAALLAAGALPAAACPPLLDHAFPRLTDEQPETLCRYRGQVVLVVNTASYCGFTPQYEGLEALYDKYRERGLAVVGFPSNDFGAQEPGSNKEIADFCRSTYGVRFPMYAKTSVARPGGNTLYDALAGATGQRPRWNFHKYLIDRGGSRVLSFPSEVRPDGREFLATVERLLAEKP